MKIFVTGGSGQTGPTIVSELIANGHTVTGLARFLCFVIERRLLGSQRLGQQRWKARLTTSRPWRKAQPPQMASSTWHSEETSQILQV